MADHTYHDRETEETIPTDSRLVVSGDFIDIGPTPLVEDIVNEDGGQTFPCIGVIGDDTIELDSGDEESLTIQYNSDGITVWSWQRGAKATFTYNDLMQVGLREMMREFDLGRGIGGGE